MDPKMLCGASLQGDVGVCQPVRQCEFTAPLFWNHLWETLRRERTGYTNKRVNPIKKVNPCFLQVELLCVVSGLTQATHE
jgi:hypothetical protein